MTVYGPKVEGEDGELCKIQRSAQLLQAAQPQSSTHFQNKWITSSTVTQVFLATLHLSSAGCSAQTPMLFHALVTSHTEGIVKSVLPHRMHLQYMRLFPACDQVFLIRVHTRKSPSHPDFCTPDNLFSWFWRNPVMITGILHNRGVKGIFCFFLGGGGV